MYKTSYKGNLIIDVKEGLLVSNLKISYYPIESTSVIKFELNKNFNIRELNCDFLSNYKFDKDNHLSPYLTDAGTLTLKLSKEVSIGELVSVTLSYEGKPGLVTDYKVNRIQEDWVELGVYTPWYPYDLKLNNIDFDIEVIIDESYELITTANKTKENGSWVLRQNNGFNDLTIIGAKNFYKQAFTKDVLINILYVDKDLDGHASYFKETANWLLNFYNELFGKVKGNKLDIVFANRDIGGGYARPGLIVMCINSELTKDNQLNYFRYLAHELAHLWWMNAPSDTYEDWLNESFAEYSAMMAIRESYGNYMYRNYIEEKAEKSLNTPSLLNIKRDCKDAYNVLYNKGPVVLANLDSSIGELKMKKLLKKAYTNRISSTDKLLDMIREETSESILLDLYENLNR